MTDESDEAMQAQVRAFVRTPEGRRMDALMAAMAQILRPYIRRIEALEQRACLHDGGVWNASTKFAAGAFVSFKGHNWIAQIESTGAPPDESPACWRMAMRKPRDARAS